MAAPGIDVLDVAPVLLAVLFPGVWLTGIAEEEDKGTVTVSVT